MITSYNSKLKEKYSVEWIKVVHISYHIYNTAEHKAKSDKKNKYLKINKLINGDAKLFAETPINFNYTLVFRQIFEKIITCYSIDTYAVKAGRIF